MYTEEVTQTLSKFIEDKELSPFVEELKMYREDPAVGPVMEEILKEWQGLQVAGKNGLMDEEQIYFAIRAFFNRKIKEIPGLLNEFNKKESGNLDA